MDDFLFYTQQGFTHVLDKNALDHILFFIALVVVFSFKDWKKALWLITFFTLGHSVTFGLSSYGYIDLNVDLIEFIIPITILIPLIYNSYYAYKKSDKKKNNRNIYFSFFFGLFHGLGFSSYFRILDVDNKLVPLMTFSLGIELAQIVVVLATLTLGYILQSLVFKNIKNIKNVWTLGVSGIVFVIIIPMLVSRWPF
ncbi:MAG: HupE/UreJ family protein [Flavobacteriaceae bacterium]